MPRSRASRRRSAAAPAALADPPAAPPAEMAPIPTPASEWDRYPSLNDADLGQIQAIRQALRGKDVEFVATEKVHGSNFAFETDGQGIAYFSRNRRLEPDRQFVGKSAPRDAMRQYHEAVIKAFHLCRAALGEGVASVIVYGEYFGGWHPHPDVDQHGPGAGWPVQKGVVAYAPGHHFIAFDVYVGGGRWLDFDEAREVLLRAGFPLVSAPVVRGTFEECLRFDVDNFQTTMPGLLGLPVCEEFAIAEGVVVRPVRRHLPWTLKRKSVQYLEACPDELRKWLHKCVSSTDEGLAGLYLCLCRQPRLESVLSKDPQLRAGEPADVAEAQRLFCVDVDEAFQKKLEAARLERRALHAPCLGPAREEARRRVEAWMRRAVCG